MKQENKATETTNNYCVNCKHCLVCQGGRYICRNELIVSSYINNVKGNKVYDDKPCDYMRGYVCKGNHFEPKISMWSKFISLFKYK
jgi:hypothetical protein